METLNPNACYPISQAAAILGCTTRTILRWSQRGVIRFETSVTNGRKMFRGRELQRIMDNERIHEPFLESLKEDILSLS